MSYQELFEQAWEKRCKKATGKPMDDEWDGGWLAMRRDAEEICKKIKSRFWALSGGSFNGIHYDDSVDILWDIHQVLRHQLWNDDPKPNKPRYTVDAFPAERFGSEPLIEIEAMNKHGEKTNLDFDTARRIIHEEVEKSDNTIAFFFRENGEAEVLTATKRKEYDTLALAMASLLTSLSDAVET